MKVLAFDCGETTGYCLLQATKQGEYKVKEYGTFTAVSAVSICARLLKTNPDLVICERTALGEFGKRAENGLNLERFLYSIFREIHSVKPAAWKNGPYKNLTFKAATKLSQHERDAFRIAVYGLERISPEL